MISIGSSDARKGLGLGLGLRFGGGGDREMKEVDLEEGEAYSYNNNNEEDYDANVDPDVALSYIDEKLQDVLGHFQKDFEGGVSADNLGAKFGGYGSFLPTYQRSPVCTQSKAPTKVQCFARSPNNLLAEGGLPSSLTSSTVPQSIRPVRSSTSARSLPLAKASLINDSAKQKFDNVDASAKNQSSSLADEKKLKVQRKNGPENLTTRKNAAIYSGLGLDMSPSSSLDNSPSRNEEIYHNSQEAFESPTSILMDMTSFPLLGELLLSPLSDDLVHLIDNAAASKFGQDSTQILVTGPDSGKHSEKISREKKVKSTESKRRNTKAVGDTNKGVTRKEMEMDTVSCERLVPKAKKIPISSNFDTEMVKVNKEQFKVISKEEPGSNQHPKVGTSKEKPSDSIKTESGAKGKKAHKVDFVDSPMDKAGQRDNSRNEQNNTKSLSVEDKRVPGRKSSSLSTELPRENLREDFSVVSGNKKSVQIDSYPIKKEPEDLKSQKKARILEDRYKEVFGDTGESDEEVQMKDNEKFEKRTPVVGIPSKYKLGNKKNDKLPTLEVKSNAVLNDTLVSANQPVPVAAPVPVAPLIIEEHWVGCDKCQKWRLLPVGMNPETLPEKWVCSMLDWLPGMNRCTISQEETTRALTATYQVPPPQIQMQNSTQIGGNGHCPNDDPQNGGLHTMPSGGKKTLDSKETTGIANKEGSTHLNPMKKTFQSSARNGTITGPNQFPNASEVNSLRVSKVSDLPLEKHEDKLNAGGDTPGLKLKRKMDGDRDFSYKKPKTEVPYPDEDWTSDRETTRKGGPSSSTNAPTTSHKYSDHRRDLQPDNNGTSKKKDKVSVSLNGEMNNGVMRDVRRKRKPEGSPNIPAAYIGSIASTEDYLRNGELNQKEHRKEKKARISEEKDSSMSKVTAKSERKSSHAKSKQRLSRKGADSMDSLKRDIGPIHPSAAATSSSSKISGSRKSRTSFHEAKGSPVESVSSSPLRNSDRDKTFPVAQYGSRESSVLNFQDRDDNKLFASKAKEQSVPIARPDVTGQPLVNEQRQNRNLSHDSKSRSKRAGKESSSRSKDKNPSTVSYSVYESQDRAPVRDGSLKICKTKLRDQLVRPEENGLRYGKKESMGKFTGEDSKKENQSNLRGHVNPDADQGMDSSLKSNIPKQYGEKSSNTICLDASNQAVSERGKSIALPFSGAVSGSSNVNRTCISAGDIPQALKHVQAKDQNGTPQKNLRQPTLNGQDVPSPLRKDSSSQVANNALKEAKDLKHMADRLKNSGPNLESIGLYFQAALKFLYGASLLECCGTENAKHGDVLLSMQIYSSTANLCEFCAREYEKSKDMAAAALAYKCMEVAYMRVVYSSHTGANRCRHEIQAALQMVPPGESPSSSASDVDNLNHAATSDKVVLSKGVTSPQVVGNQIISAQNRPNLMRLLKFTQEVNLAMDATRRSRIAFAAASASTVEARDGTPSLKRALDFNFQDIDGFVRAVRLAMQANSQ